MNKHHTKITMAIIVLIAVIGYMSFYTIQEGQRGLLLRLGAMVKDSTDKPKILLPGLHFKAPFIYSVNKFDIRLQALDVQSSRVLTEEQKYLLVDYYIKWRIKDLPLYFTRTGGFVDRAETLLQQKVNDSLRAAFGRRTITDVVSGERGNVMVLLKEKADDSAKSLGIEVIDVRIKRIDLPEEVSGSVFDRMRVEREQAATKHRSDGNANAAFIKAQADASVTIIMAQAKADAAKTMAAGDAEAAKMYAESYQKDPAFYALYRSLQAYKNVFNSKRDILLLQPESRFFKYFK